MAKKKGKSKGRKVVPISATSAKARAKASGQKRKQDAAAPSPAKAKRLRFKIPAGLSQPLRQLAIRLRLSRSAASPAAPKGGQLKRGWGSLGGRHPSFKGLLRQLWSVDGIAAVLLAVLLFYPPYFRGLFFARELLPTHIFTAMLFTLLAFHKIRRREPLFSQHPLDWSVIALLVLYGTSTIAAWNARDAVAALLKMANYAAVYWMLAYSVRSLKAVRGYLSVFFASGSGVALLGLGAAFGTFHYKDAFVGGRIYSSLQYPNTLAAYLTAINLFGVYLWSEARGLAARLLMTAGNYLIFLAFLGTQSRGALLIYPLGLFVLLAGILACPAEDRGIVLRRAFRLLGCFALQLVSAMAVFGRVMAAANASGSARLLGWLWLLGGAVLAVVLQVIWHCAETGIRLTAREGDKEVRRTLRPWVLPAAAFVLVVAVALGGYAVSRGSAAPAAMGWKAWLQRVESISLEDLNAQDRINWSRDAFRIIASSPTIAILGAGGGGWNALYHRFQDYLYYTTEVHNHLMQVGVETGIPGMVAFIAIWVSLAVAVFRIRRSPGGSRFEVWGTAWAVFSAALALGLHSLINFNLSLGAVAILLWGLFGLERGLERLSEADPAASGKVIRHPGRRLSPGVQYAVAGALAGAFFLLSLALAAGDSFAQAAGAALKAGDAGTAVEKLEMAMRYDPWTASYRAQLAQILLYQGEQQKDGRAIRRAQEILRSAVGKSRGDFELRILYARSLFSSGNFKEGIEQLEEAVRIIPLKQEVYDSLAAGYFEAGRYLLELAAQNREGAGSQAGRADELQAEGRSYLEKAMEVPGRIEARMAAVPREHLRLWRRAPLLTPSFAVRLKAGEAAALLGRWQEAEENLSAAAGDPKLKPEAILWRGLALKAQGKGGEGLIEEALRLKPDLKDEREKIEKLLPAGTPEAAAAQRPGHSESSRRGPQKR
ncbi:MAG: hypothetical protein ACPLTR_03980 [Thermacetogeniaceae bacterium]